MTEIEIVRQEGKAIYPPHQCSCGGPTEVAHEQLKALLINLVRVVEHILCLGWSISVLILKQCHS